MLMKLIVILCAVIVTSVQSSAQSDGPDLEEIVERHIEAVGGLERIHSLKTLRLTGVFTYRGWEYPFTLTQAHPEYFHLEVLNEGKKSVVAFDGETIWEMNEARGIGPQPIRDLRNKTFVQLLSNIEGALMDFGQKGHRVRLIGPQELDGRTVYRLRVDKQGGNLEDWDVDASTFLLSRKSTKIERGDEAFEQTLYFMDYKAVDGLMIPHYIERLDDHRVLSYEIREVALNTQIDHALFNMGN